MNVIALYVLKISGKIFEYHLKNHLHLSKGEVKQSPRLTSPNDKYRRIIVFLHSKKDLASFNFIANTVTLEIKHWAESDGEASGEASQIFGHANPKNPFLKK